MPNGITIAISILHILLALVLIVVILLQSSKRTGLSGSIAGASETFFGKNQVRTIDKLLSMWTGICAIAFLITSLVLAYGFSINKNAANPSPSGAPQPSVVSSFVPYKGSPAANAPAKNGASAPTVAPAASPK